MKFALTLLTLCCFCFSYGQKIKIIDQESKSPIAKVVVSNEDTHISVVSNDFGLVDLSEFKDNDLLSISHISYQLEILTKKEIIASNYTVRLYRKSESLEEVVLSVNKIGEKRNRVAEQVEIVSKLSIEEINPQTSADLLASVPGVRVQKSQFGGGSPVIRGMEANRILLVIDGVRMNNAIYRSGHLQNAISVSPTTLERTEIVFGPSSVIYGSDALGGVVHFYTKKLKTAEKDNAFANANLMSRYSTVNDEITFSTGVEAAFEKWASYTAISHSKFGDLTMGKERTHGFENWGKVFEYSNNTSTYYDDNPVINPDPNVQKNTGFSQNRFITKILFPTF